MQDVLGAGPLETGLAFLPLALAAGAGAHAGSQLVSRGGVRVPMAGAFAVSAAGLLLLSGADPDGSYLTDVLPGCCSRAWGSGLSWSRSRSPSLRARATTRAACCPG